jgi:hypothetical protein
MEPNNTNNSTNTNNQSGQPTPADNQQNQPNQQKPANQQKPQPQKNNQPKASNGNLTWLWWLIAIVIIVLIIVLATRHKGTSVPATTSDLGSTSTTPTSEQTPSSSSSSGDSSYSDAIEQYSGREIVFTTDANGNCIANPATLTTTPGRVLVANNATTPIVLKAADRSATLAPYHYMTVPLKTAASYEVFCNDQKTAAAKVTIQ